MKQQAQTGVEIYRITLDFIGKIMLPSTVLIIAINYNDVIEASLEGLKLSKFESPFVTAQFSEIVNDVSTTETGSPEEKLIIKKIETQEAVVKAQIDSGQRTPIPTPGIIAASQPSVDAALPLILWRQQIPSTWIKPNDIFGRTYFAAVNDGLYIWSTRLDAKTKRAEFTITTSPLSHTSGEIIATGIWLKDKGAYEFLFQGNIYRLNLHSVKKADNFPSHAAYISVDRKNIPTAMNN